MKTFFHTSLCLVEVEQHTWQKKNRLADTACSKPFSIKNHHASIMLKLVRQREATYKNCLLWLKELQIKTNFT